MTTINEDLLKYESIVKWWQNKDIKNAADLETVLNGYIINFAYHSGKIENDKITYYDTRDIFDYDGISSYTGDLKTLFEIKNAKDAMKFIFESFDSHVVLDENFVKQTQKLLTKGTYDELRYKKGERPGEFKKHDYVTGRNEVGAAPEDVSEEISELLSDIAAVVNTKALIAGAFFHVKFENIHPFSDGNGRTGRLLMNYYFVEHNHPPIIIHEEDRHQYYQALEAWDEQQSLEPMKEFLRFQIVKTWNKQYCKETNITAEDLTVELKTHTNDLQLIDKLKSSSKKLVRNDTQEQPYIR